MQRLGFWLGVSLFVVMLTLSTPEGLSVFGLRTAAGTAPMIAASVSEGSARMVTSDASRIAQTNAVVGSRSSRNGESLPTMTVRSLIARVKPT